MTCEKEFTHRAHQAESNEAVDATLFKLPRKNKKCNKSSSSPWSHLENSFVGRTLTIEAHEAA